MTIRPWPILGGGVLLLLSHAGAAAGQAADTVAGPVTVRSVASRLQPGRSIRIRTVERRELTGRLHGVDARAIRLVSPDAADAAPASVPLDSIDRLWVRGRSWKMGAIVGGIVGAVAGAVVVGSLADFACSETDEQCGLEGAVLGGLVFGAGGAAAGAAVGLLIPRWKLKFPP